jgi:hypothetical protein
MLTTTISPIWTPGPGARRSAARLPLVCAAALASVALLMTAPAQAQIETPLPPVVDVKVSPTHVGGLYGVHVEGGWLLR